MGFGAHGLSAPYTLELSSRVHSVGFSIRFHMILSLICVICARGFHAFYLFLM